LLEPARTFVSTLPVELAGLRAALVVAHPGHELRLHGWLEAARPEVFVLTDGAGRTGRSRLPFTSRILTGADAIAGRIFGRFTDPDIYAAVLAGRVDVFTALASELAAALTDVDYVVGDAMEGYNPAHDLCRLVVDAAVALAPRTVRSFDFPLVGPPDRRLAGRVRLVLDDVAFARKLDAAHAYDGLGDEVAQALSDSGRDAFRVEALDPSVPVGDWAEPPYYERYGEQQVARGAYGRVLRYRDHVRPIAEALARLADR